MSTPTMQRDIERRWYIRRVPVFEAWVGETKLKYVVFFGPTVAVPKESFAEAFALLRELAGYR